MAITLRGTKGSALTHSELDANFSTLEAADAALAATDVTLAAADDAHAALTIAHGATGAVVGTTNAQTLTNKTIVAASNTITTAVSGSLVATELNAALAELDGDITAHLNDTTAAHAASAISNTPAGAIAATTVQAAIDELDTEKQPKDATLTALAATLTAANKIPYATALDTAGELDFKDEDTMASDSATAVPSQQSVKAYVDGKLGAATETTSGIVELATSAEVATGTDTARAITPAGLAASKIVAGTSIATTSGTAHDFTSIPSWVKRITVMFSGVSTNGTSLPIVQLGDAGGIETTGYLGSASYIAAIVSSSLTTTGFALGNTSAATLIRHGAIVLSLVDASSNLWAAFGTVGMSEAAATGVTAGTKSLSATLTQIRLTTVSGTDTFDAGSVNIIYE